MTSSRDTQIINLWLERQPSPHTRSCYRRDSDRLLAKIGKSLNRITLGDLATLHSVPGRDMTLLQQAVNG